MKFFTETLYDTKLGVIEFHFERVGSPSTTGYYVAVIGSTSKTYNFTMLELNGKWRMIDTSQLPKWLVEFEDVLSDSIKAHITRNAIVN
jgi:hypothetical protein